MAFKTVTSLDADVTIAIGGKDKKTGKSNPTQAEGYYLGFREVTGGKFSTGKPSFIYFLQTKKGNLGVWGKTDLNRKMGAVTPGTMIRITHDGMTGTPNGDMHKYKVEVDDENTIDVSGLAVVPSVPEADDDSNETPYSYGDNDEEDSEAQEADELPPRVASSGTAAERQARVQALLGKKAK